MLIFAIAVAVLGVIIMGIQILLILSGEGDWKVIIIAVVLMSLLPLHLADAHMSRIHARDQAAHLASACAQAPSELDGKKIVRVFGRVVNDPTPLGMFRISKPEPGTSFLLRPESGYADQVLVVTGCCGADSPYMAAGTPLSFCGHEIPQNYWWWPRIGHQGRHPLYGEPEGPYRAVHWRSEAESPLLVPVPAP